MIRALIILQKHTSLGAYIGKYFYLMTHQHDNISQSKLTPTYMNGFKCDFITLRLECVHARSPVVIFFLVVVKNEL